MPETRFLPLRILYTINSSPQYILARSLAAFPVQPVTPPISNGSHDIQQVYGTVSLRACLDTVCRSSPELVQDKTRDYSVYVLDPLESISALVPAPMMCNQGGSEASTSTHAQAVQQRGVAVGLGLMSLALVSEESNSLPIAGTLINPGSMREALEVIFALRETPATHTFSSHYHESAAGSVPAADDGVGRSGSRLLGKQNKLELSPISLAKARAKGLLNPQAAPAKPKGPDRPITEADILMASGITYTGPPKKKGRPAKNSSKILRTPSSSYKQAVPSVSTAQALTSMSRDATPLQSSAPFQSNVSDCSRPHLSEPGKATSKQDLATTQFPSASSGVILPPSALNSLATLPTEAAHYLQEAQNAALLQALNAIDSTLPRLSNPDVFRSPSNPILVNALRQLISASVLPQGFAPPQRNVSSGPASSDLSQTLPSSEASSSTSSPSKTVDDEIVILNKENINPTAFRRRAERERAEAKLLFLSTGSPSNSCSAGPSDHSVRSGLGSARTLSNWPSPTTTAAASSSSSTPSDTLSYAPKRKRRLSNFFDNRSATTKMIKQQDANLYLEKVGSAPASDPMRHYPRLSYFESNAKPSLPNDRHYNRTTWGSPADETTKSSPTKPTSGAVGPKRNRETMLSASSPARPSAAPKKKYVVPEWARTHTATQARLSEEAQKILGEPAASKEKDKTEQKARRKRIKGNPNVVPSQASGFRNDPEVSELSGSEASVRITGCVSHTARPLPQVTSVPITATPSCPIFGNSDRGSSQSPDRPTTPSSHYLSMDLPVTPPRRLSGSDSLFTPTPRAKEPATQLFSPFGAVGSPVPKSNIWSTMVGMQTTVPEPEDGDEDEDMVDLLSQELDDALNEVDPESPPASLPIASSDVEYEDPASTLSDHESHPIKQHWVGLPPSSPPPPSSPLDAPQELPPESVSEDPTSDPEIESLFSSSDMDEIGTTLAQSTVEAAKDSPTTPTIAADDLAMYFDLNDFAAYFSNLDNSHPQLVAAEPPSDETMALFNQFTNIASDDSTSANNFVDTPTDPTLLNIDLSEFWASMQPLLEAKTHPSQAGSDPTETIGIGLHIPSESRQNESNSMENIDHEKLAEEVHSLFSGCLT